MKKASISLLLVVLCSYAYCSTEPASLPKKDIPIKATEVYIPLGNTGQFISVMDLSQIRLKDLEKMTGRKMKFAEKVNFKIAQRELRKNINNDGSFSSKKYEKYFSSVAIPGPGGINWGGLALGFFLSLIGVLIAYLISGDNRGPRIRWAWIGAAISFVIVGAILII